MTDSNLVEVVTILDRSASMGAIAAEMRSGFREFVAQQRKEPGRCVLSLYQFDNYYDTCFEERDIHAVGDLVLDPRGSTALLDALGRTINSVGSRLSRKPEHFRPGGVIVLVITDGQENCSKEFTPSRVRTMIEHQEKKYSWKFLYLSADPSAFADAQDLGIRLGQIAFYSHNAIGTQAMYNAMSASVSSYRGAASAGRLGDWQAGLGSPLGDADGVAIVQPEAQSQGSSSG